MTAYKRHEQDLRSNQEQWVAYESKGHLAILAGPGSGKTKLLTIKLARVLSEDIEPPRRVACLTYNNECVAEIRKRLSALGMPRNSRPYVGTVHSFCLNVVIRPFAELAGFFIPKPIRVAPAETQSQCLQDAIDRFGGNQQAYWLRTHMDKYRRTFLNRSDPNWKSDPEMASIIEEYERSLHAKGFVDFDDMVLLAAKILEQNSSVREIVSAKFPVLFVDEYQDLGLPLHRIVELLCFKSGSRLIAVGDPDQSIYGFTGAHPETLLSLSQYPEVLTVRLKYNYRCGQAIMDASEIALGESRGYRGISKESGKVEIRRYMGGIEAQCQGAVGEILPDLMRSYHGASLGSAAILYPSKVEGELLAAACQAMSVPHVRNDGGAPYSRTRLIRWIEDAAKWITGRDARPQQWDELLSDWVLLCLGGERLPDDATLDLRQRLGRFLWQTRVPNQSLREWLSSFYAEFRDEILGMASELPDEVSSLIRLKKLATDGEFSHYTLVSFAFSGGSSETLNLATLHSAKGLEFDFVIIVGLDEGLFPRWGLLDAGIAEARRLFYVGLTRAKRHVVLTYSGFTINKWGRKFDQGPSRFIKELMSK